MRILYIVPYTPSLIRVRPYQLIRSLARRGHHVDLLALWSSSEEEEILRQMERENANVKVRARRLPPWRPAWNCLLALPSRTPLQAAFSFEPGLMVEVERALREDSFDVVHVEHLRGSLFGLKVRALLAENGRNGGGNRAPIPVVWDSVDCISHLFTQAREQSCRLKSRLITRLELPRTRPFEGWLVTQFDQTLASSALDGLSLQQLAREQQRDAADAPGVSVLPNGVDLDYFRPPSGMRDPATIVFAGKMSYHANVTAASYLVQEIMPRVWQQRPDVKVVIAGKNPPRSFVSLASATQARCLAAHRAALPNGGGIEVTGAVPDLRPYLHRATLSAAPLVYGAGIQNKVLEAMACATPVIATARAVSALAAQNGRDVIVADQPDAFAHAVIALLADVSRRTAISLAGRAFVQAHHDWHQIGGQLESTYERAIAAVRAHSRLKIAYKAMQASSS